MKKSIVMTLRINPKNECDLYELIQSKGGIKKTLNYLYEQYQMNQKIDRIIENVTDKIKKEIDFSSVTPSPQTTITKKEPVYNKAKGMANRFIK